MTLMTLLMSPRVQQSPRRIIRQMLQADGYVHPRNLTRRVLRPLDDDERLGRQNLIPAEIRELGRRLETIEIEMIDRRLSSGVLMDQREGRTRHVFCNAITATNRARQRRLSGAKI